MIKALDKLTVTISVENVEETLVEAMEISKSKLIEWREIMVTHGYQHRVKEIQEYIDIVTYLEETRSETTHQVS